jgi:hypothetical protein
MWNTSDTVHTAKSQLWSILHIAMSLSIHSASCIKRFFNGPAKERFLNGKSFYMGKVQIKFISGFTFTFLSQAIIS